MDRVMDKLRKILTRETITYILVGFATTAVDYIVFALVNELMKAGGSSITTSSTVATIIAWIAAVLFAFFANKIIVFQSKDWSGKGLFRELVSFTAARVLSGLITLVLMRVMVGLGINEYIAKVFTSVFNLIFNYVASKLFIFKSR